MGKHDSFYAHNHCGCRRERLSKVANDYCKPTKELDVYPRFEANYKEKQCVPRPLINEQKPYNHCMDQYEYGHEVDDRRHMQNKCNCPKCRRRKKSKIHCTCCCRRYY